MDYVQSESVRKAFNIFLKLVEKSEIKKSDDSILFNEYDDLEVSYLLRLIEDEAGIMVIKTGDTLYYSPRIDNRLLGFTNEELRNALKVSNNTELYTVYIIIVSIVIKFYNGENYNNKCRTMIKVEELEGYITKKMESINNISNESLNEGNTDKGNTDTNKTDTNNTDTNNTDTNKTDKDNASKGNTDKDKNIDRQLNYNFSAIAKFWLDLSAYDEKIVQYSLSTGTRVSYIFKTIRFLKEQGLANIDNENEIFTTNKMDALVMGYYPENNRKKEILSFIEKI